MGRRALILLLSACTTHRPAPAAQDAGVSPVRALPAAEELKLPEHPPAPCPAADKQDLDAALDEAARRFDKNDYATALACAEQAARIAPRSVEAQHDRADALVSLERFDDAKTAFAMALALDPEDSQTLASAADFYVNRVGSEHDHLLIGLEYARRGSAHVGRRREDRELLARLALLESEALDDLGRADEALPRIEAALRALPDNPDARYERALVLFHLCKLDRAREAFDDVLKTAPDDAYAHHHMGLILERDGREVEAAAHFTRARALLPSQFPPPQLPPADEFRALVDKAVSGLDPATRSLMTQVHLEIADLPQMEDLLSVEPPFPPTILGLYRAGGPGEAKSIVFYRKNLARAAGTPGELAKQVRITLLHEIGHMVGADEDELRARGFE